jgi:hypothetical protein
VRNPADVASLIQWTRLARGRSRATSETFKTGVLNLVYGPANSTGDATYEDAKVHLAPPEQ